MWIRRVLGIDLGSSSVKVVQVAVSPRGRPVLAKAAILKDRAELPALLKTREWRKPSEPIHASFSSERVIHRPLNLPFKDPAKLRQALPFELEGEVPFSAEEMIVAYFPRGSFHQDSGLPLIAMATPKQEVRARLEELRELGVEPSVLEPEAASLARVVLQRDSRPRDCFLLMEAGASKTNLLLFQEGFLNGVRSVPVGLSEEKEGFAQEELAELERTFLMFQSRAHGQALQGLYLCGGILEDRKAMEQIGRNLDLPVKPLDALEGFNSQAPMPQGLHPGRFATALGLAIHGLEKSTVGSNLRLGEFHYSPGMAAMRGRILVAGILLGTALGLGIADIETKVNVRQRQLQALQQEVRSLFRQAFPEVTQVVDPVLQMQRLLEERKGRHLTLLSQDPRTTVLELLREISLREQARALRITELDISGENLNIIGEATAYDIIEKAKDHWSASPLLEAVEVKNAKKNPKSQLWDFQCTARRKVS